MSWNKPVEKEGPSEQLEENNRLLALGAGPFGQAALGALPYVGGAIAGALAGAAAKRSQERIETFLQTVAHRVEDNADLALDEVLHSETFITTVIEVLEEVGKSDTEDRRRYLEQFLINAMRRRRPDENWMDLFRRYLPRLAGIHMLLLADIYSTQRSIAASDRLGRRRLRGVPYAIRDSLELQSGLTTDLLRICAADLENLGLLIDWRVLGGDSKTAGEEYSLSRNGLWFARFIEGDWGASQLAPE